MDFVLLILAILGFSCLVVAAYVISSAGRRAHRAPRSQSGSLNGPGVHKERRETNRRSGEPVQFPLTLDGIVIPEDRRKTPDRRLKAAA